jgi:hypothetical protein
MSPTSPHGERTLIFFRKKVTPACSMQSSERVVDETNSQSESLHSVFIANTHWFLKPIHVDTT